MRRALNITIVLVLVSSLVMASGLFAQIKVDPQSKLDRIEGTVQSIDKKNMTLVVRQKGTANLDYTVVYNDKTIFTYRNDKATLAELKDGLRVVALGKADGATKLVAARIDIRDK